MRFSNDTGLDRQNLPVNSRAAEATDHAASDWTCQDLILVTESAAETESLGAAMADLLSPGSVISLEGGLGAGKTLLTRGLASGLHCRGAVASPTFTILMEHPAGENGLPLYHFDVYRLLNSDEFIELGFDEYLDGTGVSVLEWGDLILDILPERTIRLSFSPVDDDRQSRMIRICWPDGQACLEDLAARVGLKVNDCQGAEQTGGCLC
jgi:tRNA threonylcarbamoyladenosine biosynthesis protein TsaE